VIRVQTVRPIQGLSLVLWYTFEAVKNMDPANDQDTAVKTDLAGNIGFKLVARDIDVARIQRARKGPN
jgi:hypothetical protein